MTMELARVTTLEEIQQAMTARRKSLGLSQMLVDDISGLQTGYTGKLECGIKGLGKISMPLILGALKCELLIVPATSQFRDKTGSKDDFFSRRARKARAAQLAKQTPKKRRAIARAAGKASARKRKAARAADTPSKDTGQ